jgi:NADPH:quinone reductase-like Zn-dependent oxidoreductase
LSDVQYDLIFDVPGNHSLAACRRVLKAEGRYILIGHENFGASGGRVFGLIPRFLKLMLQSKFIKQLRGPKLDKPTRPAVMAALAEWLETGKITPPIDRSYPLEEFTEAFRHMTEDELLGKVILNPTKVI